MEKKISASQITQTVLLICCTAMLAVVMGLQYRQSTVIQKIKAEIAYLSVDKHMEQKAELQSIKDELRVLAYNQQANVDPSILKAANDTVRKTKKLPLLMSSAVFREGRLVIRFGKEIKESDIIFGVSLRQGLAISNHGMRTAPSYSGEIPHPLADQFILVLYRSGTFEKNGQQLSGFHPIMRWSAELTPIDEQELPKTKVRAG